MQDFSSFLSKLIQHQNLTVIETSRIIDAIMDGKLTPAQTAGFLVALTAKGETIDEVVGAAQSMRRHAIKIYPKLKGKKMIDTCGTGGDCSGTFNISTTVAFVVAGAGIAVAKHGNRAVSSKCGSADVLEALGVNINLTPKSVEKCIEKIGIGFLFAPQCHPAMKYAGPIRKELGVRTIFNILGPLTNPAEAPYQLLGVFDEKLTELMADALARLGVKKALVVHGHDGLDEITITSKTRISEITKKAIRTYDVLPKDFGLKPGVLKDIQGGANPQKSAKIIESILKGEKGSRRDIVLMNAAGAFLAVDEVKNFKEGVEKAIHSIDSGKALEKLEEMINWK